MGTSIAVVQKDDFKGLDSLCMGERLWEWLCNVVNLLRFALHVVSNNG